MNTSLHISSLNLKITFAVVSCSLISHIAIDPVDSFCSKIILTHSWRRKEKNNVPNITKHCPLFSSMAFSFKFKGTLNFQIIWSWIVFTFRPNTFLNIRYWQKLTSLNPLPWVLSELKLLLSVTVNWACIKRTINFFFKSIANTIVTSSPI